MSALGLVLNGALGVLLVGALVLGWRLERRLRGLKATEEGFAHAVAELDRATARARDGLSELMRAAAEASEVLAERIERAKALAARLEARATEAAGAGAAARVSDGPAIPPPEPAPAPEPPALAPETMARIERLRALVRNVRREAGVSAPEGADDDLFGPAPAATSAA